MSFFSFLFGSKEETPEQPVAAPQAAQAAGKHAPGTHIAYSASLVDELKQEHQQLVTCFQAIAAAFASGDLVATCREMENFRGGLLAHLLKENVRFYIYLEHALIGDTSSHALVHQFRHEMDGIGKTVVAFLGKYAVMAEQPALANTFGKDLAAIGDVLVRRIRNEEDNLYPLYLPAY